MLGSVAGANAMSRTSKNKKAATADEIAEKASRGKDVSSYFSNQFAVVRPPLSRQTTAKTLLARALAEERAVGPRKRKAG
jgi:hypothetical protein